MKNSFKTINPKKAIGQSCLQREQGGPTPSAFRPVQGFFERLKTDTKERQADPARHLCPKAARFQANKWILIGFSLHDFFLQVISPDWKVQELNKHRHQNQFLGKDKRGGDESILFDCQHVSGRSTHLDTPFTVSPTKIVIFLRIISFCSKIIVMTQPFPYSN